jgi:hypothetical protein
MQLSIVPRVDLEWASLGKEDNDTKMVKDVVLAAHVEKEMSKVVYEQAHKFVLFNHLSMEKWMECYNEVVQRTLEVAHFKHWVRGALVVAMEGREFIP